MDEVDEVNMKKIGLARLCVGLLSVFALLPSTVLAAPPTMDCEISVPRSSSDPLPHQEKAFTLLRRADDGIHMFRFRWQMLQLTDAKGHAISQGAAGKINRHLQNFPDTSGSHRTAAAKAENKSPAIADYCRSQYQQWHKETQARAFDAETMYTQELRFANERLLSVFGEFYQYSGGANGTIWHQHRLFDVKKGSVLGAAVVNPADDTLLALLRQKLLAAHAPTDYFDAKFPDLRFPDNLGLSADGQQLVVVFNPYQVAPRSTGVIELSFSPAELLPFLPPDSPLRSLTPR